MPKLKVEINLSTELAAMLRETAAKDRYTRETWVERAILDRLNNLLAEKNAPPMVFTPPNGCESRYGKTARQLKALFKKHGEQCALCGATKPYYGTTQYGDTKRFYVVDHTEPAGKPYVRGILCDPCNTLLGYFGDTPDRLRDYIKRKVAPKAALRDCAKRTGMTTRRFKEKALDYLKKTERAVKYRNGGTYPRKAWNDKRTHHVWVQS